MQAKLIHKYSKRFGAVVVFVVVVMGIFVMLRTPSLNRVWDDDVNVLASVAHVSSASVTLQGVRDWRYSREAVTDRSYIDRTYRPDDIVGMWMYEQVLGRTNLIAHTFVVFEFADVTGSERYLGLSVETRRELREEYSVIGGALRKFEITHIWATETDLVTRRVVHLDYPLTRYRLTIPLEYQSQIFMKFIQETAALSIKPQWYNTVTNNCTSSLVRYVNDCQSGAIPLHASYVLTGKMDEYLGDLGFLDTDSSVAITRDYLIRHDLR